jgi:hypothetical protein
MIEDAEKEGQEGMYDLTRQQRSKGNWQPLSELPVELDRF